MAGLVDAGLGGGVADHTDGLARAFASARVGLGTLAAHGQAAQVANATVTLDALETLEIHANLPAQIAFDGVFAVLNGMDDLRKLLFGQVLGPNAGINVGASEDLFRVAGADAVDVAQGDLDAFIGRDFYSDDASHIF